MLLGLGTMIMAFHFEKISKTCLVVGLLQFLTSAIVLGWVLSIYWGLLVVVKSFDLPYLGNVPTGGAGAPGAPNDVANFLGNQPRSDQENYMARGAAVLGQDP